jgi:hypothetical protein
MAIITVAKAAEVGKKFQKMDIQKKTYKTVIFDLFGTVALWDRNIRSAKALIRDSRSNDSF